MATRLNKRHSDSCRQRIKTSQLINRLQKHAFGKVDMTNEQRDSAKFLISHSLAKPAQTIIQDVTHRNAQELSDAELADIATRGSTGATEQKAGKDKSTRVH